MMLMDMPLSADFSVSLGLQVFHWFFPLVSMEVLVLVLTACVYMPASFPP